MTSLRAVHVHFSFALGLVFLRICDRFINLSLQGKQRGTNQADVPQTNHGLVTPFTFYGTS